MFQLRLLGNIPIPRTFLRRPVLSLRAILRSRSPFYALAQRISCYVSLLLPSFVNDDQLPSFWPCNSTSRSMYAQCTTCDHYLDPQASFFWMP